MAPSGVQATTELAARRPHGMDFWRAATVRVVVPCLVVLLVGSACQNLDRFDTKGSAAYCGDLVAADFVQDGLVPDDWDATLTARLELDVDALDTLPGQLWTSDAEDGLCAPDALFAASQLRAIEQAQNDAIAVLDFGEARDHSFLAWVDSSCQGTMLAVVSLMRTARVEIRLFKPAPEPDSNATAAERPGFGVFLLDRSKEGCSF
jgi:hypothetical protein